MRQWSLTPRPAATTSCSEINAHRPPLALTTPPTVTPTEVSNPPMLNPITTCPFCRPALNSPLRSIVPGPLSMLYVGVNVDGIAFLNWSMIAPIYRNGVPGSNALPRWNQPRSAPGLLNVHRHIRAHRVAVPVGDRAPQDIRARVIEMHRSGLVRIGPVLTEANRADAARRTLQRPRIRQAGLTRLRRIRPKNAQADRPQPCRQIRQHRSNRRRRDGYRWRRWWHRRRRWSRQRHVLPRLSPRITDRVCNAVDRHRRALGQRIKCADNRVAGVV